MSPLINDGDVVIIKKQDDAESGKICVVMINGFDATLKEIKKEENGLWVLPKNPYSDFSPRFFTNEEINKTPIKVIGVAVEIRRSL
jgi:repressor LexA